MSLNKQEKFWSGDFGNEYTKRNTRTPDEWDKFHLKNWGVTKVNMYNEALSSLSKEAKILEIGCNTGMQLVGLKRMGFKNLYGIELQSNAVEESKKYTSGINIIQGSGFDVPFKNGYFDLVFTSGVLIHISPDNLANIISEIYRCSSKYILGFEYFAEEETSVNYRGNEDYLWKMNYCKKYKNYFPNLKVVFEKKYPYLTNKDQIDMLFMLSK